MADDTPFDDADPADAAAPSSEDTPDETDADRLPRRRPPPAAGDGDWLGGADLLVFFMALANASDALARLDARVATTTAPSATGCARLALTEAAGLHPNAHAWVHPLDLALRDAGLTARWHSPRSAPARALCRTPSQSRPDVSAGRIRRSPRSTGSRTPEQPFDGKPIGLMGASAGVLGAARAQYHLRQCFVFLNGLVMNRPEVMISPTSTEQVRCRRQAQRPGDARIHRRASGGIQGVGAAAEVATQRRWLWVTRSSILAGPIFVQDLHHGGRIRLVHGHGHLMAQLCLSPKVLLNDAGRYTSHRNVLDCRVGR